MSKIVVHFCFRWALILALSTWLSGCSFLFNRNGAENGDAKGEGGMPAVWKLDGRIGVRLATDAWQANLFWDHDPKQDRLRISGPLSQGMVSIIVQKDLIYINEGDGINELSHDPENALRSRLGFSVPLQSLRYWVLGLPDPGLPHVPLAPSAQDPAGFTQAGWAVRPARYTVIGNRSVPERINIRGSGVSLKLIADHWDLGDSL